jgi:hypothetical protein
MVLYLHIYFWLCRIINLSQTNSYFHKIRYLKYLIN